MPKPTFKRSTWSKVQSVSVGVQGCSGQLGPSGTLRALTVQSVAQVKLSENLRQSQAMQLVS